METPERYLIVKITKEGTEDLYKVFATWIGGYTSGGAWRMNSGIVSVRETEHAYTFVGTSGSEYKCIKGSYGANHYTQGVLNGIMESAKALDYSMTIMDKDFDVMTLNT